MVQLGPYHVALLHERHGAGLLVERPVPDIPNPWPTLSEHGAYATSLAHVEHDAAWSQLARRGWEAVEDEDGYPMHDDLTASLDDVTVWALVHPDIEAPDLDELGELHRALVDLRARALAVAP